MTDSNRTSHRNNRVALRPATADDALIVYQWQIAPGTRTFARNLNPPTLSDHLDWFARRLADPDCRLWIAIHNQSPCGFVRLDLHGDEWEVSIVVAPGLRGLGLGKAMLAEIDLASPGINLVAEILPGNDSSKRLFLSAGYKVCRDGLLRKS